MLISSHRLARAATLVLLAGACAPAESAAPPESYGFVALLGRDTVSLERVTRRGDRVVIDGVDRFPRVRRRHTEVRLGPDGGVRHLAMDVRTPSEAANQRERRVEVEVADDSVRIVKTDLAATVRRHFGARNTIVVAHVPQMYSLYDLYFRAARLRAPRGDTAVRMRQFYVDREFDRFSMHNAEVRFLPAGRAEIRHDWLSGPGDAVVDSIGRLREYSGARTTYDVRVKRLDAPPEIDSVAARLAALEASGGGARPLSPRDSGATAIGPATITVAYGRPLARGRALLGALLPYDRLWRTGANEATYLATSTPITLGGLALPAGGYTLWTIPRKDGTATLIVNAQTGQWGTSYDRRRDVGRVTMTADSVATPVEAFTITVVPTGERAGELRMEWGTFRWVAPIAVSPR